MTAMKLFKMRTPEVREVETLSHLKDFLYLDFERVRSFVAQFYSGLPETRTLNGNKAESAGAVLGFEAIAKSNANVLTEKNVSETQSLHLALYNIFETEAVKQKFVYHQDLNGPLIKVKCQIRIVDYQEMAKKVNLFSALMPLINKLQSVDSQYTKAQKREQQQTEKQQKQQFEDVGNIIDIIFGSELYGIGYIDGEPKFRARLQKDLLQFRSSGLIGGSEDLLTEEWTVVGMVVQKQKKPEHDKPTDPMAQAIHDMNTAFDDMKKQMQASEAEVEVIPIAIYRELKPGDKK
jgi:hypothetical protein